MTAPYDDPKLTAYAFGELPEAERKGIEERLARDPEARKTVEELRRFGKTLAEELKEEPASVLTPAQRARVLGMTRKSCRPVMVVLRPVLALAACAVLAAAIWSFFFPVVRRARRPEGGFYCRMAPHEPEEGGTLSMDASEARPDPVRRTETGPEDRLKSAITHRQMFAQSNERHSGRVTADQRLPMKQHLTLRSTSAPMPVQPAAAGEPVAVGRYGPSIEDYAQVEENPFRRVKDHPLSTFSIDVDTASYSNVRRFLNQGRRPPKDAVRIEELVNYFRYEYPPPKDGRPFTVHLEAAPCPWRPAHRLVAIALKGRVIENEQRPPCNLVFLLDVSGSMQPANKLPLVKRAMTALARNLNERDRVAIVVYSGAAGLVLPPTPCGDPKTVIDALERLRAGGSTAGGAGITLAYATAKEHFDPQGVNRVILCTDGDFNVGVTQTGDLVRLVQEEAKEGIFLTVLGFGMGNYKDSRLEQLADKGNGNYGYIDTFNEARKMLVDQASGTLVTIAKDVKIQVEFNPARVAGYRLIGYENRMLRKEDFNDDKKDAGEIGAGHTVTALYEVVPGGRRVTTAPAVDSLKYQPSRKPAAGDAANREMLTVKLRYKLPDEDTSTKIEFPFVDRRESFLKRSDDFRFASAVAAFGMLLRDSEFKGSASYEQVLDIAGKALADDVYGYRREFLTLVRNAGAIR